MAERVSFPAGAGLQPSPVRQVASGSDTAGSPTSRRLDFLSVKTPLLPRHSGINMESARSYGADMEKRRFLDDASDVEHIDMTRSRRSSRSTLKWVAGLALFSAFAIAIFNNIPAFQSAANLVADVTPKWRIPQVDTNAELYNRQDDAARCSDTSNCTNDLVPFALKPLPLGSIKPLGWLRDQMQGMADGLAGHEHDFYVFVQDGYWTGGDQTYSNLNEGPSYWFNGLVPLAYGLGDQRLIGQVQTFLSQVLQRQDNKTGWIGPVRRTSPPASDDGATDSQDLWGRFPFLLGAIQMAEADPSYAPEIVSALYRFIPDMYKTLDDGLNPTEVWGRARYQDAIISLQWLYENYPQMNGTDQRPLLSNTMYRLKKHGADWIGYYQEGSYYFQDLDYVFPPIGDDGSDGAFKFTHGVNVGQGLKTPAVDYRFTHNASLLDVQRNAIDWTLQYHGSSAGTIVGDERENGQAPTRGSELCTAVEAMYSMEYAYAVTGVNAFADNAERLAFNALPVMLTADNWAHQYLALPNQPWAAPVDSAAFWNVNTDGITFGLAPNYPCCTVNHPQGYPKFASHMFMSVGDDGLAHVLLSPGNVTTSLDNGAHVNVAAVTDYPFSDILTYQVNTDNPFTLYVRVPNWASNPVININGNTIATTLNDNSLAAIPVPAGQSTIQYVLESSLVVDNRANDTIAVYKGALLYALDVGYTYTTTGGVSEVSVARQREGQPKSPQVAMAYAQSPITEFASSNQPAQARTYNISNTMAWNYAIDPASLKWFNSNSSAAGEGYSVNQTVVSGYADETTSSTNPPDLPNPIWDYQAPAQYIKAVGCMISWPIVHNLPDFPPAVKDRTCDGNPVELILRPYGSLKVHMAELPTKSIGAPSVNGTSSGKDASSS